MRISDWSSDVCSSDLVEKFIHCSGRDAADFLGEFPPRQTRVTVKDVAVNAIMAGCKPQYAPTVIALTRALMDEEYDVWGVACSTKGSDTLVIVNGHVRSELAITCGTNVFEIGCASCMDRECRYVYTAVWSVSFNK